MDKYSYSLANRIALITGASSGIGAHLAQTLARAGAKVVLGARRTERIQELAASIQAAGGEALAVALDVESESSIRQAYDAAEKEFGVVNTIYANAGIHATGTPTELAIDDFDKVMNVNLRGVFLTAREGARRLINAGADQAARGRIVLVSSIGSFKALDNESAYCVSKAGVVMMAKSLAHEWAAQKINVNAFCPGSILTEMSEDYWASNPVAKQRLVNFPRKRLIELTDMDGLLLLLGSDASRALTGAAFTLDDAQTI